MANPNAKMKITKKDGVTFQSNVEHVKFTIEELIHAANKDVARFIRREAANVLAEEYKDKHVKGSKETKRRNKFYKKHANRTIQYWARKKELDLQVGYKNYNWMAQQEQGEYGYKKLGAIRNTVYKNIPTINKIQAQYISELNKDNPNTDNGLPDIGDGDNV